MPRGRRHDQPLGPERPRTCAEVLRGDARPDELVEGDAQLASHRGAPQVEDPQAVRVEPPQAPPLAGGIDRAGTGCAPLGPGRLRLERRVQRPRFTTAVVASLGRRRAVGRKGGDVEPRLAMDPTAERAERRAQT